MWKKLKQQLHKYEKTLMVLAASLGLSAVLINFDFNLLEAGLYDFRVAHGVQLKADPGIVLVTLDDYTTKTLDEFSPLTLDYHAKFMEKLERLQPRGVGYLFDWKQITQANPELFQSGWASRFVDAANRMRANGTTLVLGTPYDVTGEVVPPYPLSTLPHSIALIHKDGNVFSDDKVTRRALLRLNKEPLFHLALAEGLGKASSSDLPTGSYYLREVDGELFFFRYHGSTVLNADQDRELPYQKISFADILRDQLPSGYLRGKTVLVGTLSKERPSDFAFTPYSHNAFASPRLAVHANILDSLIHHQSVVRVPAFVNWLSTFSVTLFVIWWVLNTTPLYGLFLTVGLTVLFIGVFQLLFQITGLWLRESQPLMGIFFGYYMVVPYRLIREYKKRWDYQRKNELLTQVEELKTNFLSLVTHDLKTPVARIQGLAEMVLRRTQDSLENQETLKHIIRSTDELNRFITSILELSKVESQRLHLHLESKDINQLIERLITGFEVQAAKKNIKINVQLDPLFPIKIDPSLISKVMSNLIDNAIKYSPAGSEIWVESHEVDPWVEIIVRDRGIGLSDEESQFLFTRFYRAKNDETARTSGTGLGLYLTKYFIEAHRGRVEFSSRKGQGSQFRILLPIVAPADPGSIPVEPGLTRGLFRFGSRSKQQQRDNRS